MSLLEVTQSQPSSITLAIQDINIGTPRLGLVDADLKVKYAKFGESDLTLKTLSGSDLDEIGNGIYKLNFTGAELDSIGTFIFTVNGVSGLNPQIKQYQKEILVVVAAVPSVPPAASICKITGNLIDLEGNPVVNVSVVATLLRVPSVQSGSGVSNTIVPVQTDSNGFFEMDLIRGARVEVVITESNIRKEFTVPDVGTIDLFVI